MSPRRATALAVAVVGATLAAASCGGDEGGGAEREAQAPLPPRVVADADRNCRWMQRNVTRFAREARRAGYDSGFELTTEGISRPGLALTERLAARQRALRAAADDPRFDAYLDLFDPILALGEQRLEAGRENDEERARRLQDLLTDLGDEQREAAARAGLRACEVDLLDVVLREAFG